MGRRRASPPVDPRLVAELLRRAGDRAKAETKAATIGTRRSETFLDWALRVPEPKTGPLNFELFPFQRELYAEGAELAEVAVMKSTQVGASSFLARWAMYWPDVFGLTALYLFPADRQMNDFSNQRIAPLLRSPHLAKRVASSQINNVHQRQIGDGWLNLRGAQAEAGLESVDADVLAIDERDLIPPKSILAVERRLSAPTSRGLIRSVGWPTVNGYGIARLYNESDRRRWFVKCQACKTQQFLWFFNRREGVEGEGGDGLPNATSGYVDVTTGMVRCGKCDKPLSPEVIRRGQWVAEFPNRAARGYHVHHLLVPGADLRRLIAASQKQSPSEKQSFFNRDIGEPYSPKEGRLSVEALQAAQSRGGGYTQGPMDLGYKGDKLVTMGVDVASVRSLHVRISEHVNDSERKALFIGEVPSFNELPALMDNYGVHMCAIDHLPERRLARGIAEQYAGRVYLVNFATAGQKDVFTVDEEQRRCSVRRTDAMDATINLVRKQCNLLPLDLPPGYSEHMQAPVRFVEKDEMDRVSVGYKSIGSDDFFMAETYDLIATELWWYRMKLAALLSVEITTLDEILPEFQRSSLNDPDYYHPGPPLDMSCYEDPY